jgi:MFS transporter, Spinster family, sphingosine-1-phosphate transporter
MTRAEAGGPMGSDLEGAQKPGLALRGDAPGSAVARLGAHGWWLLISLTTLNTLATIDRNILVLLLRPIQTSLDLTATQATLAIGTSFAVANLLAGLPAGWAADRFDRRKVISAAVALWSGFAMLTGLATSFAALFTFRAGVGLTEGLLPPAGYSLLRDRIPPTRQARAFGVFSMAPLVGTGLAFILGGALIQFVSHWDYSELPVLGALAPWGMTIFILGAIGLPLALIPMTFRRDRGATAQLGLSTRAVFQEMARDRGVYLPLALFGIAHAMLTGSLNFWVPAMLDAKFHLSPVQIGSVLGPLLLIVGPVGLYGAGLSIDKLDARRGGGPGVVAIGVAVGLLICAAVHPLAPTPLTFWALQGTLLLFATTYLVITSTIVARTASPHATGRVLSVLLVAYGVMGGGLAPIATAIAADHLFSATAHPIPYAMSAVHAVYGVLGVASALWLWLTSRSKRARTSPGT